LNSRQAVFLWRRVERPAERLVVKKLSAFSAKTLCILLGEYDSKYSSPEKFYATVLGRLEVDDELYCRIGMVVLKNEDYFKWAIGRTIRIV